MGRPLTVKPSVPRTFLIVVVDLALTGLSGTDQFHFCSFKALGVFCSKAKLIIPFELTCSSLFVQLTLIVGLLYAAPAPAELVKSGKALVGQALGLAAAQLWLLEKKKSAIVVIMMAKGRVLFIWA